MPFCHQQLDVSYQASITEIYVILSSSKSIAPRLFFNFMSFHLYSAKCPMLSTGLLYHCLIDVVFADR